MKTIIRTRRTSKYDTCGSNRAFAIVSKRTGDIVAKSTSRGIIDRQMMRLDSRYYYIKRVANC